MKVFLTGNALREGVRVAELEVRDGLASGWLGGSFRIFRPDVHAVTKREAVEQLRGKLAARRAELAKETARLDAVAECLGRGELPMAGGHEGAD